MSVLEQMIAAVLAVAVVFAAAFVFFFVLYVLLAFAGMVQLAVRAALIAWRAGRGSGVRVSLDCLDGVHGACDGCACAHHAALVVPVVGSRDV